MTKTTEAKVKQSDGRFCWTAARDEHVEHLDIDKIIQYEKSTEHYEYHKIFRDAAHSSTTNPIHKPALIMLAAIMEMNIYSDKDGSKPPQFKPFSQWNDRIRSADPSDFSRSQLGVIKKCIEKTQNLVVKTRLEHISWEIDRRDRSAAQRAIDGYVKILEGIYSERFTVRGNLGPLSATSERIFHTMISLYKYIGCPELQKEKIEETVEIFFSKAYVSKDILCILRFGRIVARVNKNKAIAVIEKYISESKPEMSQSFASLWRLLAKTYGVVGNKRKYEECRKEEAEIYASIADCHIENKTGSSIEIANLIKMAMDTYQNTSGNHNRYSDLRQKLVEVEKKIPAEMQKFSSSVDLSELAHSTIDDFKKLSFSEGLMNFRVVAVPLNSKQTMNEAIRVVSEFPLHTMFPSELTDDDGKTIAVSEGASLGMDGEPKGDFDHVIMRNEQQRRGWYEMGTIDPARSTISRRYRVSEKSIIEALRCNPFIPSNYLVTLSRGFERYFNDDWMAAIYILIPMFEGLIRHALTYHGYSLHDSATSADGQSNIVSLAKIVEARYSEIACIYDDGTAEDLYRTVCARWGPRLRHRTIHALHNGELPFSSDARYACWLIWRISTYHLYYKDRNV